MVLRGAMPCCAVLRTVFYLLSCTCQISFAEGSSSSTELHHTRFVRTTLLNYINCSRLSSAQLYLGSAQRSTVRCCAAVPYLRCDAALCYLYNTVPDHAKTQVPGTGMYVCVLVFLLSSLIVLGTGMYVCVLVFFRILLGTGF